MSLCSTTAPILDNVRRYKPSVPNSEPPKWGIKRRFLNAIDVLAHPTHTESGRGTEFLVSITGCEKVHTKSQICSSYGSRYISVLNWKFGKFTKLPLYQILSCALHVHYMTNCLGEPEQALHRCLCISSALHYRHKRKTFYCACACHSWTHSNLPISNFTLMH